MFYKVVIFTLFCNTLVIGLPQDTLNMQNAVDSFQNAVQQQTFQSVLVAIEERLRNLDNIYSMQLSETITSKLDQYHRKLESLDVKIIRLESLVTFNLNKISENMSTKIYNDDMAMTQTYRKLDNMYNGLSHRMNYMDRKSDMAFEKLQNRIDATLLRVEKMEENMMQRNSDVEVEISETLSETLIVLEDLKSSSTATEQNLFNITAILNETHTPLINSINLSMQSLIRDLNQSFSQSLAKLENTSSMNLNVSEENNSLLKSMKLELKEDFNEYANKVADMNEDIWKRNDIAEESLTTIETVANSTRIEVQNGIRALMLQIGKLSGKGTINNDKDSLDSLRKSVNLSMEKIITNQELFLESCHRVQMDESQIESEISDMLGKLIDMLEKKMTTVMKDLKNVEKTVKNHDSRTTRNIYQANTNIVTLFEKTTKNSEITEKELQEIKFYINSLFTFVQDVLPKSGGASSINQNTEVLLRDLSGNITNLINNITTNNGIKWAELETNLRKFNYTTEKINDQINNISVTLSNKQIYDNEVFSNTISRFLEQMRNLIADFNKTISVSCSASSTNNFSITDLTMSRNQSVDIKDTERNNCTQDYSDLIDIRADRTICNSNTNNTSLHKIEDTESQGNIINETSSNGKNSTSSRLQDDENLKKAILEVFGTPTSSDINATTENPLNKTQATPSENKNICIPTWANFLNIKVGPNSNDVECDKSSTTKRKIRRRMRSRIGTEDISEYDDSTEYIDEAQSTTESSTESDISPTRIVVLENTVGTI